MQLTEDLLSQVTYTRNGVSVNAVYAYSQSKSVLFWFRGTNGLTMAEDSPEPGDTITIGEGFRFVSNDNRYAGEYYMFGEPLTYMFDGVAWVTPREIPDRDYASLTPITIDSVSTANPNGSESDTVFYITTTSSNDRVFDNSNYDDVYTVLPYFSFVYPNGNIADVWCARVDGKVIRLYIHEPGSQSNIGMATMPEGGVLTIRAGFGILNTEALQEDVSYVYNGTGFVALNAPSSESDYEITTPNDTHIKVGQDLQIEVRAADGITAYFRYAVNNKEIATISSLGVLRGLSEGTVTVSVWYGNLPVKTVTIIVDPLQKEDIESFEIVTDIDQFIIPVNGNPSGSTNYFYETVVESGGYVLMGQYTLTNGVKVNVEITADMIGKQDFAEAGNYAVIITDPLSEMTAELEVEVINQRVVGTFSSLGVSGYDVDDSRNASGTWNGHMMVGMDAFSTNTLNMTGKNTAEAAVLRDMSNYIVYEDAKDGVVYQNTYDEQGKAVDTPISLWQLGSRYLVLIRPNGYSGTKGYGVIDGEQIPIYRQGDKITFKAGMPAYKFIGNADNTAGYYIVEGVRESDITYYCYEDNRFHGQRIDRNRGGCGTADWRGARPRGCYDGYVHLSVVRSFRCHHQRSRYDDRHVDGRSHDHDYAVGRQGRKRRRPRSDHEGGQGYGRTRRQQGGRFDRGSSGRGSRPFAVFRRRDLYRRHDGGNQTERRARRHGSDQHRRTRYAHLQGLGHDQRHPRARHADRQRRCGRRMQLRGRRGVGRHRRGGIAGGGRNTLCP